MGANGQATYDFLLDFHCNCVFILYDFRDIIIYLSKLIDHVTQHTPKLGLIYHAHISTTTINLHIKFGDSSFSHFKDMTGVQKNYKYPHWGIVCHHMALYGLLAYKI